MLVNAKKFRFGVLLALAFATLSATQRQRSALMTDTDHRAAPLAPSQVVDYVEPLCRTLFPEQDVLRFQAVQSTIHHKGAPNEHLWSVDCLDTNANLIAHVLWNPETKRTLQFCSTLFPFPSKQKYSLPTADEKDEKTMDEKQAVTIAREWVPRLRPVSNTVLQHSRYQAKRNSVSWTVQLQLPDGTVRVWINPQSGKLQNAIMQDIPVPDLPDVNTTQRR